MSCGLLALSVEKGFLRHNCRPAHGAGLLVWWGISLCAFLSTLPCAAQPSAALTPVVLQLKWTHAFQFAGYYMAEELGYYRDAGLEVRIVEAGQGQNPVDEVVAGRAQFGVGASSLLLAHAAGKPVVVLGVVQQHSPQVLIALEARSAQSVHDLADAALMIEPQAEELLAYLQREGIRVVPTMLRPHEHSIQPLLDGRARVMSAYSSYEPYFLRQLGVPYHLYTPRSAGIDFYGDNLFTSADEVRRRPLLVEAFRAASMRGWQAAVADPEAAIELVRRKYAPGLTEDFLRFEAAELIPMMHADLIRIGYMSSERWQHIASVYGELGLLAETSLPAGFLYQPELDNARLAQAQKALMLALSGGLLALLLLVYLYSLNRRLRTARDSLEESEWRYRMLAEQMRDVIWVLDLEEERFTYMSPSVTGLSGQLPAEIMAGHYLAHARPSDAEGFKSWLAGVVPRFLAGEIDEDWHEVIENQIEHQDGHEVWLETVCHLLRNLRSGHLEVHGVTRDISERRRQEETIRHLARHDPLTGLPNRTLFSQQFVSSLGWARRERSGLALVFLDLDRFKPVNDTYGHQFGDRLLCKVAQRIRACLREVDLLARLGGDEFVIVLHGVADERAAQKVTGKIAIALREPFWLDGIPIRISCSQGIALYPQHGGDEFELSRKADAAMYAAKRDGRDQVCLYVDGLIEQQCLNP